MNDESIISFIDERLCFALYSTSKTIVGKYQPYLAKLNMTYPQYLVFMVLDEKKELSVKELGSVLYLDSGTLTPVLKRMEKAGLVERNRSISDERSVLVKLTDKAETLRPNIRAMQDDVSCATGLDTKRLEALKGELKSLQLRLMES